MSIEEVRGAAQELHGLNTRFQAIMSDFQDTPRAWRIRANPCWGSSETVNNIALFDTKEAAQAYWDQSLLPKNEDGGRGQQTPDNIHRSFRPDSLLWDYNPTAWEGPTIAPMLPGDYGALEENPAPPTGPIPELKGYKPLPARYGKDYDVGRGPVAGATDYANMDGAEPSRGVPPKEGA